jgi:hypothetical protein
VTAGADVEVVQLKKCPSTTKRGEPADTSAAVSIKRGARCAVVAAAAKTFRMLSKPVPVLRVRQGAVSYNNDNNIMKNGQMTSSIVFFSHI